MLSSSDKRDRSTGPTASTVGTILGLNPYATPLMAWMEATGRAKPDEDSEALRMGHLLEPVIRAEYEYRTGRTVTQPGRYSREHDGVTVTATADGLTRDPAEIGRASCRERVSSPV